MPEAERLFEIFGVQSAFARNAAIAFALFYLCCFCLRAAAFFSFKARRAYFKSCHKELKTKRHIAELKGKSAQFIKEYAAAREKGAPPSISNAVAEGALSNARAAFFNARSLTRAIGQSENGVLVMGAVLAFCFGEGVFFGSVTGVLFAASLICGALFDFDAAYADLKNDMTLYLDVEVGRFFLTDAPGLLAKINRTFEDFCLAQTRSLKELSDAISNRGADAAQSGVNEASRRLETILADFINAAREMTEGAVSFVKKLDAQKNALERAAISLENILHAAAEVVSAAERNTAASAAAMSYVEKNQETLQISLNNYELALQRAVSGAGDALGAIVAHHTESAYLSLSGRLEENIARILKINDDFKELIVEILRNAPNGRM